ncbi:MAG: hypothetical protein H6R15_4366 [Proteobacteria bacterium]|nr:hypothetical protein [Pseudomonadota bacterium]
MSSLSTNNMDRFSDAIDTLLCTLCSIASIGGTGYLIWGLCSGWWPIFNV